MSKISIYYTIGFICFGFGVMIAMGTFSSVSAIGEDAEKYAVVGSLFVATCAFLYNVYDRHQVESKKLKETSLTYALDLRDKIISINAQMEHLLYPTYNIINQKRSLGIDDIKKMKMYYSEANDITSQIHRMLYDVAIRFEYGILDEQTIDRMFRVVVVDLYYKAIINISLLLCFRDKNVFKTISPTTITVGPNEIVVKLINKWDETSPQNLEDFNSRVKTLSEKLACNIDEMELPTKIASIEYENTIF